MGKELIRNFLKKVRENRLNIRCVGDNLIDEYYECDVSRVSPEAPIPILHTFSAKPIIRLGGVGNVAHQLRHFNASVDPLGFTDDYQTPMEFTFVSGPSLTQYGGFVPIKRRFIHNGIQVGRWDVEAPNYGLSDRELIFATHALIRELGREEIEPTDVTIFSDYDKGTFKNDLPWVKEVKNGLTIVDPKKAPLERWDGCTIFKPNEKEARELSGKVSWKDQVAYFANLLHCKGVFITHGGEGVHGIWQGEYFSLESPPIKAESVIGAGDFFVAILALAIGHGFEGIEAAEIAYTAGAQYVRYKMNRPICPAEMNSDKIIEPQDLTNREFKLVFTNGCFDLLHSGHLESLKFAKSKGDKLVVAVNSDDSVKRLKGNSRPIIPLSERMQMLAALEAVDFVTYFNEDTPLETIQEIRPDVLIKSGDYQDKKVVGRDIVPEFYFAPYIPGISTSDIVAKIVAG